MAVGQRAVVRGVVTVGPGRILGEQIIAVQDATGGICVKLPAGNHAGIVPGRVLEVDGVLAAPYANLELRAISDGIRVVATGSQPQPRNLTVAQLGEETEGLLARLTVTVRRIDTSSSGSVTLIVEDASGEGRVFLHAAIGMTRAHFTVGQGIAATGIVGDRLGLYRLWPRSQSDIHLLPPAGQSGNPEPSPTTAPGSTTAPPNGSATGSPGGAGSPSGPSGSPGTNAPAVVSIADALRRHGQTVAIEGVVTAPSGLLDADSRRVTLQDSTAAILIRLPAEAPTATVGQRMRVVGQVGTYYGAAQLTVGAPPTGLERATVNPASVRAAPLAPGLEWRLVTVSGRVDSVRRDGDNWRAELTLSGGGVPIVGLGRSGIASTALVAGREATITGIVRRAYPTANDQRLAVVPRSASDVALGSAAGDGASPSPAPGHDNLPNAGQDGSGMGAHDGAGGTDGPVADGGSAAPLGGEAAAEPRAPDVAFADLSGHDGETVHVGGRIEGRDGLRLRVNDGSATAVLRLTGRAEALSASLLVGHLINAQGVVERTASGGLEIRVDDPALVVTTPPMAARSGSGGPAVSAPSPLPRSAPLGDQEPVVQRGLERDIPLLLIVAALVLVSLGVIFQQRMRRLLASNLAMRRLVTRWSALRAP
jgi:hypothetical protein